MTAGGVLWNDFEETCAGPVAWDLACLRRTSRLDGRAALEAYGHPPDDAELEPYVQARRLQSVAWSLLLTRRLPRHAEHAAAQSQHWQERA